MKPVDKKVQGRRVRALRKKRGMSQTDLAEESGMSQQGIDNIERGLVERVRRMPELAQALGTTTNYLMYGEGKEDAFFIDYRAQARALLGQADNLECAPIVRLLKKIVKRKRPKTA